MKIQSPRVATIIIILFVVANAFGGNAPTPSKEALVTASTVNGTFDIALSPQAMSAAAEHSELARMSLDKQFHGPLSATSVGEMIAFRSATDGSAGYVAMETVQGTLDGHAGRFVLQHSSTMRRGEPTQSITVVPDSGTDGLTGLAGRMRIEIAANGTHAYRFDYTLPAQTPQADSPRR